MLRVDNIRKENLEKVEKYLKEKSIDYKVVTPKNPYDLYPDDAGYEYIMNCVYKDMIGIEHNLSGTKFHKILVSLGICNR